MATATAVDTRTIDLQSFAADPALDGYSTWRTSEHRRFLLDLIDIGGPGPGEYRKVDRWLDGVAGQVQRGTLAIGQIHHLLRDLGDAFSILTMQGQALLKPFGYSGDFQIIDRIYQQWISPHEHLAKWDHYFHAQKAPRAVRNRKSYFVSLLKELEASPRDGVLRVFNVASGPARGVADYLNARPQSRIHFSCIDQDSRAIEYAQALCKQPSNRVQFKCGNVFRHSTDRTYDLVWVAGLFDYLDDKAFRFLATQLYRYVAPGGELVIGNFCSRNTTRNYMEIVGDWHLRHRSADRLADLANQCEFDAELLEIRSESSGVNLFLHARR